MNESHDKIEMGEGLKELVKEAVDGESSEVKTVKEKLGEIADELDAKRAEKESAEESVSKELKPIAGLMVMQNEAGNFAIATNVKDAIGAERELETRQVPSFLFAAAMETFMGSIGNDIIPKALQASLKALVDSGTMVPIEPESGEDKTKH